jgi:hypothetical protein
MAVASLSGALKKFLAIVLDKPKKNLSGTNTLLAYSTPTLAKKEKRFYNIVTWCQCFNTFFPSSLIMRPNKLEGLSLETLTRQVLEFVGKARANPIGGPFRCFLLGQAPGVTSKC